MREVPTEKFVRGFWGWEKGRRGEGAKAREKCCTGGVGAMK